MGGYDYLYKRKAGGSTYCYGEIVDGANFEVVCEDESFDGIAADVEVDIDNKILNTWSKVCQYLEINYNDQIEEITIC